MGWARVTDTELMPRLVVGNAELGDGKWKKGKGFLKPNFGVGPNLLAQKQTIAVTRQYRLYSM